MEFCQQMKSKICCYLAKMFMKKEKEWWNDPNRNMPERRKIKFFKIEEFDSPDKPGSAKDNMNMYLIERLDQAREMAGVPFKITSGFRSKEYHEDLKKRGYKTSENSQHLVGNAADISTPDSMTRYKVLNALILAGFKSIGIGRSFIHVDTRSHGVIWDYY